MTYYGIMYEHKIKDPIENTLQNKVTYVIQSYYNQDDKLVSEDKFQICDGQPDNIQSLSCDELKHILFKHGMWPQYAKRIKNLEKVEEQFWKLYEQEVVIEKKIRTLENISNLQSLLSNCYVNAKELLIEAKKGELHN